MSIKYGRTITEKLLFYLFIQHISVRMTMYTSVALLINKYFTKIKHPSYNV